MATNRKIGNSFETEFCELLFQHGFWCHNMAQNAAGQPADVIAVKGKTAYLIDCKVCSNNRFPLSRVEENQHFAMETWKACGNGEGWFALKVEDEIIMIPHFSMVALSYEKSALNLTDIREYGSCSADKSAQCCDCGVQSSSYEHSESYYRHEQNLAREQ